MSIEKNSVEIIIAKDRLWSHVTFSLIVLEFRKSQELHTETLPVKYSERRCFLKGLPFSLSDSESLCLHEFASHHLHTLSPKARFTFQNVGTEFYLVLTGDKHKGKCSAYFILTTTDFISGVIQMLQVGDLGSESVILCLNLDPRSLASYPL